jgi:hypothetical protein
VTSTSAAPGGTGAPATAASSASRRDVAGCVVPGIGTIREATRQRYPSGTLGGLVPDDGTPRAASAYVMTCWNTGAAMTPP